MTLKELCDELKLKVSIERFSPVEKLVYGGTAIILTAAMVGMMSLLIK